MKCPRCGGECERDEVDNGVGMQAVGPWGCPDCHWVEKAPESLVIEEAPFDDDQRDHGEGFKP